jgi:hypothetical protein
MQKSKLADYPGGWIIGNFYPAIFNNPHLEVCIKSFSAGEGEPLHYQLTATELTVVVSGECRLGDELLQAGDLLVVPPMLSCDFLAITDCVVVGVKWPSKTNDKQIGSAE